MAAILGYHSLWNTTSFNSFFFLLTTFSTPSCVEDHLLLESQCGHTPLPCAFCSDLSLYCSAANCRQSTLTQACCKSSEPSSVKSINSLVIFERDLLVSGRLILPWSQYYLLSFLISIREFSLSATFGHQIRSGTCPHLSIILPSYSQSSYPNSTRLLVNHPNLIVLLLKVAQAQVVNRNYIYNLLISPTSSLSLIIQPRLLRPTTNDPFHCVFNISITTQNVFSSCSAQFCTSHVP